MTAQTPEARTVHCGACQGSDYLGRPCRGRQTVDDLERLVHPEGLDEADVTGKGIVPRRRAFEALTVACEERGLPVDLALLIRHIENISERRERERLRAAVIERHDKSPHALHPLGILKDDWLRCHYCGWVAALIADPEAR